MRIFRSRLFLLSIGLLLTRHVIALDAESDPETRSGYGILLTVHY